MTENETELMLHLGASSDAVDLGEGAVEGVEQVQSAAGRPHPALVPSLQRVDQTQCEASQCLLQ